MVFSMSLSTQAKDLFSYRKYWAECFGVATFLPTTREEMDELGWEACDIIVVTGDAYVDHPSFGMAVIGRTLEAQGFRVGIIDQPDWSSKDDFMRLGAPNLFFGVTAGNMDSMINRYTADRRLRSDDAYTPGGLAGKRPDRAAVVYSQRCKEAYKEIPIVLGGIEASLRRIAHYDYWEDKVRRSVVVDATADMIVYGNGERAIVEIAHRLAAGDSIDQIQDVRGTAFQRKELPEGWLEIDSTRVDKLGKVAPKLNPYLTLEEQGMDTPGQANEDAPEEPIKEPDLQVIKLPVDTKQTAPKEYIRLPAFERVRNDPVLYAHASRILHKETNPYNARAMVQSHGNKDLWVNPPPIPLETNELDTVFEQPYKRVPHPKYGGAKISAYEMIRFSVNIMRGCFGGCTFCSITEHEGRIIQNRSEDSIIRELEIMRDEVPGFTGAVSDLGGPTANMYRLACKSREIEASCRRLSCVFPTICKNLGTDHKHTTALYRRARALPGIKKISIASGLRYDLAVEDPEYIRELVTHHVGGYLKIAPEHTEDGVLNKMMKPGMGTYDRFKEMFEAISAEAGKKQYLIPYFIAAHPGTRDEDMMNLALWLKNNDFRADQVQTFYPSPMATATAMYHSQRNPLKKVGYKTETVETPRTVKQRKLHKAYLRYHDPDGWPMIRDSLKAMGRADLIGNGKHQLVPAEQPADHRANEGRRGQGGKRFATQHTGLPKFAAPRSGRKPKPKGKVRSKGKSKPRQQS
nr:YgiQ family radical SAM protein [Aestuariirhabdus haliotis]